MPSSPNIKNDDLSDVCVVSVTYGARRHLVEQMLFQVLNESCVGSVVLVDNGSVESLEDIEGKWPGRVDVIKMGGNFGSAAGYAAGIQHALKKSAVFICLLDDDNKPKPGALESMRSSLIKEKSTQNECLVAYLGYRPTHQKGVINVIWAEGFNIKKSSFLGFDLIAKLKRHAGSYFARNKENGDVPYLHVTHAPYGGLFASRSLFQQIGLPKEDFVLYADDTEYTNRIIRMGGSIRLSVVSEIEDIEDSWHVGLKAQNNFERLLLGGSDMRSYYGARNQAWLDLNVNKASSFRFWLNRCLFMLILKFISKRTKTESRFALLQSAINDGFAGRLGINSGFKL
jgi:GT2 family glycosyltransferase